MLDSNLIVSNSHRPNPYICLILENVTKSIISNFGSTNYPLLIDNTFNSSENIIVLKYWKSKKLFKYKLKNIILKKKYRTAFEINNYNFKYKTSNSLRIGNRFILKLRNTFDYVKNKKNNNKGTKVLSLFGQRFAVNTRRHMYSYVFNPYFVNFESDLHKSFWTFLGTPLFDIYFQKSIYSMEGETARIENKTSISKFYKNVLGTSKNTYNINYLLRTLTELNESRNEQTENHYIDENLDTSISTGDDENCSYFSDEDLSTFRIHYDDSRNWGRGGLWLKKQYQWSKHCEALLICF